MNVETVSSRATPCNADAVAFCPYTGWEDLLACGCYELIPGEETPERVGRLALLSATLSNGLTEICALEGTGVLDCAWLPAPAAAASSQSLLAAVEVESFLIVLLFAC